MFCLLLCLFLDCLVLRKRSILEGGTLQPLSVLSGCRSTITQLVGWVFPWRLCICKMLEVSTNNIRQFCSDTFKLLTKVCYYSAVKIYIYISTIKTGIDLPVTWVPRLGPQLPELRFTRWVQEKDGGKPKPFQGSKSKIVISFIIVKYNQLLPKQTCNIYIYNYIYLYDLIILLICTSLDLGILCIYIFKHQRQSCQYGIGNLWKLGQTWFNHTKFDQRNATVRHQHFSEEVLRPHGFLSSGLWVQPFWFKRYLLFLLLAHNKNQSQ